MSLVTENLIGVLCGFGRLRLWSVATGCAFALIALTWLPVGAMSQSDSPIVLSHSPAADAIQVPVDKVITVAWSQPMAAGTDFVVTGPMGFVGGTFAYDKLSYSVSFAPDNELEPAARYGVVVAGQTDAAGRVQNEVVQWSFDTVAPTSVLLAEFDAKPTVRQAWWWTAWPWLMVLISAVSLTGFFRVWMQSPIRWVERPEQHTS